MCLHLHIVHESSDVRTSTRIYPQIRWLPIFPTVSLTPDVYLLAADTMRPTTNSTVSLSPDVYLLAADTMRPTTNSGDSVGLTPSDSKQPTEPIYQI